MNTPREPDIIIEDIRFLLDAREDPARIAKRLGYAPHSLERALHRWGQPELAQIFGRVGRAVRH